MFGLQPTDLIGILIVAVLLFGPARLPQIGRALGSTMKEFQNATREVTQSVRLDAEPEEKTPEGQSQELSTVPCKACNKQIQLGTAFCYECGAPQ